MRNNELTVLEEREVLGREFRIYGDKENPLFLAKDVAEWIEHSNVSKLISSVEDEERELRRIGTLTNSYSAWFLTEDGLYEVLMQSRKPIAKDFKKEVKKILRQIRLTGSYEFKNISLEDLIIKQAQSVKEVKNQLNQVNNRTLRVEREIEDLPLLSVDTAELTTLAKRRIVGLLGGKGTSAYKKFSKKAFSDIYSTLHNNFQVGKICAIKRKDLALAKKVVSEYKLPVYLSVEVEKSNKQINMEF